jgi:RNA polymerase sigma-70 factor (ECF subfamily)
MRFLERSFAKHIREPNFRVIPVDGGSTLIVFLAIESATDREFLESLYRTYRKMLFHIAKGYVHEDGAAEDVVQDAFVKLIPKIPLLRSFDRCRLRAYLVATVRNTAITKAMRWKAERVQRIDDPVEEAAWSISDSGSSLEDALLSKEQRESFAAVLGSLEEQERFLLEAKYFVQQTDREIAEKLQVKPDSIRMMLTRVRRKVLKKLQEEAEDYG